MRVEVAFSPVLHFDAGGRCWGYRSLLGDSWMGFECVVFFLLVWVRFGRRGWVGH